MDVKFLLAAEKEFEETVIYYNSQSEGLGFEFAAEVKYTISLDKNLKTHKTL
jgi:hypothetical protein